MNATSRWARNTSRRIRVAHEIAERTLTWSAPASDTADVSRIDALADGVGRLERPCSHDSPCAAKRRSHLYAVRLEMPAAAGTRRARRNGYSADEVPSNEEVFVTDKNGRHTPGPTDPAGSTASQAWYDVLARMSDLGDAVARWTKTAANDPDNKQKLDQVRMSINDIARKADAGLGHVSGSEFGQQFKGGAEQAGQAIGEAAQHVTEVAAGNVKSVFVGLSDAFGKAAAKIDEATPRRSEPDPSDAKPPAPDKK